MGQRLLHLVLKIHQSHATVAHLCIFRRGSLGTGTVALMGSVAHKDGLSTIRHGGLHFDIVVLGSRGVGLVGTTVKDVLGTGQQPLDTADIGDVDGTTKDEVIVVDDVDELLLVGGILCHADVKLSHAIAENLVT